MVMMTNMGEVKNSFSFSPKLFSGGPGREE
jgi:hypothetical protein